MFMKGIIPVKVLKIILIDDEPLQLQLMTTMIQKVAEQLSFVADITCFTSGESFLFELESVSTFDLCFIDIQMKKIDGLQVAQSLRAQENDSQIIFVTAFAEYAIHGYEVKAFDYLLKPVRLERLIALFERILQRKETIKSVKTLLVHHQGALMRINEDEIEYIEAQLHQTKIVTTHNEYVVSDRFKLISSQLSTDFIATHRSYMVNLAFVQQLSKQMVTLHSGKTVPLSRRLTTTVQNAFIQYYKKEVFYGDTAH